MLRSIGQELCFLLWMSLVEISSRKSAKLTKAFHYIYIHNVMFIAMMMMMMMMMTIIIMMMMMMIIIIIIH